MVMPYYGHCMISRKGDELRRIFLRIKINVSYRALISTSRHACFLCESLIRAMHSRPVLTPLLSSDSFVSWPKMGEHIMETPFCHRVSRTFPRLPKQRS